MDMKDMGVAVRGVVRNKAAQAPLPPPPRGRIANPPVGAKPPAPAMRKPMIPPGLRRRGALPPPPRKGM